MMIFPAIDLLRGRAVRLVQGDYAQQTDYGDPLDVARQYATAGATHVHIVDLDAAKSGESHALTRETVTRIIREAGLRVEIGGGIRSREEVHGWLDLGVWRCVLGTAAAKDPAFAEDMVTQFGTAVIVGIDARDGLVATHGWTATEALAAEDFAATLKTFGYTECIHTDIAKDGMLSGANFAASVALAKASGLRVVVSGGVKDVADVQQALALEEAGITGLIAGKSLFSGTLDLTQALAIAKQEGGTRRHDHQTDHSVF